MRGVRRVTEDIIYVGADDRRLAMFEGVYSVPRGVSYNSYLLKDEKTVLIDTADKAVQRRFLENVASALEGRRLDYLVLGHMEPDHSAAVAELLLRHPDVKFVCNAKTLALLRQFFGIDADALVVKEGDTLVTGRHTLRFLMAPMVHWPEVMVTYDSTDKTLFSADAFGCFGALNGALFADEVDFAKDYMHEARRYYTNIVGKYGPQAQSLLAKAAALDIARVCPLHGFVWRSALQDIMEKYALWSAYAPEEPGVTLAYASIYGHTEQAAEYLALRLRESGVKLDMFDVSVTHPSEIIASAFRRSHLVFASATYNAGIFTAMEHLLSEIASHNLQNRAAAFIENGSWAPAAGALMREKLSKCKGFRFIGEQVTIKSAPKTEQFGQLDALARTIAADFPPPLPPPAGALIAPDAFHKLSYGMYVLTAKDGGKDNGCVVNACAQITAEPPRVSVAVNKANHTHDIILKTKEFNLSVLAESAPFAVYERFGFHSGRDTDKFAAYPHTALAANGARYLTEHVCALISVRVTESRDHGSHTLFTGEVTQAAALSAEPAATYDYYLRHIKPRPNLAARPKKGFVCKICGYVHEGDNLPSDFICPLCKHGAQDFEPFG
ncbi:MAG: flavin reductase [Oscillospiraceae bacterium]|jgi:flavorubredoxin/flavin reductase (DIM6/NTAB) family NADH-FMN oxidoreductase RutF|nr:flavin reductase [Oscillospiraceae bacterium]